MDNEIELISDGDGLAVVGDATTVERFLSAHGLESSRNFDVSRLGGALNAGSAAAQAGAQIAENSGRWVKLTKESAEAMDSLKVMRGSTDEVWRAVVTENGKIKGLLEFMKPGSVGSLLTNPTILAGAAGVMAQFAMQQTMDEITDYLAVIDEKVDDILRAQKDSVLADMAGVQLIIEDAMSVRAHVGRVSDVTWSKVQGTSMTIARTQAYALLQLDALAEKLESKKDLGDIAKAARHAESTVNEWLAVLARCFQLQEAAAILELDRVLDAAPEELDRHRVALQTAREGRRERIAQHTERLITRMDAAAGTANTKVLLHPVSAKNVVTSGNKVATAVVDFHTSLGIESGREAVDARAWLEAVTETRDRAIGTVNETTDKALGAGAQGIDTARRLGSDGVERARSASSKLTGGIADRARRLRKERGEA